jgi:hypothetical protein
MFPRRPVVEPADLEVLARQLGREPRGVLESSHTVDARSASPAVVKTAPQTARRHPVPDAVLPDRPPVLTAAVASRLESDRRHARDVWRACGEDDAELAAALPGRASVST